MTCSACGTTNEPGRNFCKECGQRLSLVCRACGATYDPGDKFCGECGATLVTSGTTSGASSGSAAAAAEAQLTERRLVSVLFVDLVGFTSLSEVRDAEDVRAMLASYFEAASDAVERHGGAVEKFIGDAVMAVWGTPVAHEDDAERAVRSALEIVDRVEVLGSSLGLPLQARAGVFTGEAVATMGAVGQGMVAGDLVNTASRLQTAADAGTVLVSEATFRATARAIAFEPVEPLTLKGKVEPIPAWRAVRVVGEVGGFGRGVAPEPPFVGRNEDLRMVKELLHATGREGRPRLVAISGVAGIGKSRLVWELQKYVDGLTETVYWHQGRCPAYGDGVAFWALAEMVRSRARIADGDDPAAAAASLSMCLDQLVPDAEERHWMEPRLGHLLGLTGAPPGSREELFGAWRRFFERVADQGSVLLVFEDLHWADPGLLDFVESLLEFSRTSPLMVVTLTRPELAERRPGWGAGLRSSTAIHLERLPDDDIRAMVTGYVHGLPAAGLDRLVSRAEGIPLYAVETVRMLADRGVLEQAGETYLVVAELGLELDVPETLHALVAARLDGLPPDDRALVQDAAVAGHSFTLLAVGAVSGRSGHELEERLRTLVRKEFLELDLDPRSPERGQYHFVQAVIREVAYSTLTKTARRTKHRACAQWLESLGDVELAGVIASHYLDAYRSEPGSPDAEELAAHARDWLGRAADRALSLGSPKQTVGYAIQALTLTAAPAERADLLSKAARAALFDSDVDRGWQWIVEASATYRAIGDPHGEGRLLADLSRGLILGEYLVELTELLTDVERRLRQDRGPVRVLVLGALSSIAATEGRNAEAVAMSAEALELAQTMHDDEALAAAASAHVWALGNVGRHWESALLSNGLVELAKRSGSAVDQARAYMISGIVAAEEDPRKSLQSMLECAAIAARTGIRNLHMMALANAAEGATDLGEFGVAAAALTEANAEAVEAGVHVETEALGFTEAMLAAVYGDAIGAAAQLELLAARRPEWDAIQMHSWFLRVRAFTRLLDQDAAGAYGDAWDAVELDSSGANAPMSLWMGVQAACELRDPARVTALLEATAALRGRWIDAVRGTARAAVAALLGDSGESGEAGPADFESALDGWLSLDLPLDHALATICACCCLPPETVPAGSLAAATAYLTASGGTGLLERLVRVRGRSPEPSPGP